MNVPKYSNKRGREEDALLLPEMVWRIAVLEITNINEINIDCK